jgi:hypothetical protein
VIGIIRHYVAPAAYKVLPSAMQSDDATAMLLAIGWQESRFTHRQQVKGPARGFWQFEQGGGIKGVMSHPKTKEPCAAAMQALGYRWPMTPFDAHCVIEHNDIAAFVFARLLLWTVPGRLPSRGEAEMAWRIYTSGWRPGKPHYETWAEACRHGWGA